MAYIYHGPNEPVDFPEQEFQKWYGGWSRKLGLNPNPDDPNHHYDYRAAFSAGAAPDPETNHWPSQFKAVDHPNRIVDGIDTLTGKPVPKGGYIYRGADPDYGPQPEPDERRSLPGDIAAALAGGLVDLVEMGAQAARHGQAPEEAPVSTKIIEGARSLQEAYPVLRPSVEAQTSEPRRWIYEGTRMAIPSLGAGAPGAVGGFVVGGFPGAVIGAGSGGVVFGLAEYDSFLEEVREYEKETGQKLDPDLVNSKALKTAIVETGFEGAANMLDLVSVKVGGRALEPLKAIVRKRLKTGAKDVAELTAKGALRMGKPAKEAVKALAGTTAMAMPTEVGTEMAQSYFETKFRNDVGLKAGDPIKAAKDVIGPTVVMTFLFGLGATGFNHRTRKMYAEALSDPKASPQDRVNAIRAVNAELGRYDKKNGTKYAEQWANDSLRAVQEGRAIGIDENVLRKYGPTPDKPKREPGAADVSKPGNIITGEGTPPPGAPPGGAGGPAAAPAETFANTGVIYSENIPAGVEEPAPIIPEQEPEQIADEFSEDQLDEILSNETNTEPSEAQVQAGNYKKGHMKLHGLDISIENPKGSVRKGVDKSGKAWENEIKHHYGYIRGTVGKDKDHLDVFLGPNLTSTTAYVINQVDPGTGKFDEHKIMMGFNSREEAEQGYLDNYEEGWQGLGSMVETSMDEFKAWAKGTETKKPYPGGKRPVGEPTSTQVETVSTSKEVSLLDDYLALLRSFYPYKSNEAMLKDMAPVRELAEGIEKAGKFTAVQIDLMTENVRDYLKGTISAGQRKMATALLGKLRAIEGEGEGSSAQAGPAPEVVATFRNDEVGWESTVRKLKDGRFSVQLKDLGSGNTLPTSHIFPDEERAIEDAQRSAGVKTSLKTPEVAPEEPKDSTIPEKTEEAKGAKTGKPEAHPSEEIAPAEPELTIEDYSDKSFVIRGNTNEHGDRIKAAGKGIFSIKLKGGPGWVFGLKQKDKVREALKDLLGETPSKQIEKQEELPKKAPAPVQPKAEGGSPAVQGGASVQEKTAEHRRDLERKGTTRVGGIGYTIQQADTGHYYYTRTEKGIRIEHGGAGPNVWSRENAIEEALKEISHDLQVEALRRKPAAEEKKPEPREGQPVDKYTGQAGKTYYVDGKPVTLQPRKPGDKNPTYRNWGDAQEIFVRFESGMAGYVHHSELRETPEAEALKKKPADKVVGQKTPDLRKGIDLTVTGQRRNLPGNEDLWYTVHKNRDGVFVVTIGKHDSEYDFARIYGEGDTAEAAYKRAVGQLRKDIRAKAAPVAEGEEQKPKHDIQAELDSMSDDDIYSMLGVENPEKATPSPAPQEKKTAAGIAKKAGVESLSAVQEGMKALGELFGGANKLSMGLTFDEETYAKAKPHFQKMWAHAKEAGYTLKELVDHIIAQFGEAVKPYVARFMIEQRTGSKPLDKGEDVDIISEGVKDGATVTDTRQQAEGSVEHDRDRAEGPGSENLPGSEAPGQAPGVPRKPRAGDDGELRSAGDRGEGEGAEHEKPQPKSGTRTRRGASSGVGGNAGSVAGVQRPGRELNHRIEPGGITRQGSWKDAARNNLDAIEIVKTLERENRLATPEEKAKLVKYVGWGASELANKMFPGFNYYGEIRPSYGDSEWTPLVERMVELLTPEEIKTAARSTQYAHYTSEPVIRSIYTALERFGFTGGNIIEPGMGIGHFAGMIPDSMNNVSVYTGIEMDHTTAAIAKALYPGHNIIQGDFTKEKFPRDFFDLAIGNPPFSDTQILADPEYKKHRFMLHDYFFAKSIDRVRPGGLLVFITSKGTMDKVADKARRYLADRADLIGAIRMPQTAFKQHAGTEVVTDTIFLQKRMEGQEPGGETWMDLAEVQTDEGPTNINEYFARHPEMVLGRHALQGSMYRANMYTVLPKDGNMEDHFAEAIGNLPEKVYSPTAVLTGPEVQERVIERDFNPKNRLEGGLYVADDGTLMSVEHGSGVPATSVHKLSAKDTAWLKDYCALRDALKQAHYDQLNDGEWKTSLKALQRAYDAFVKKNGPINKFTTSTRKETDEDGKECTVEVRRYVNERFSKYDAEFSKVWTLEEIADSGKIKKGPPLLGRVVEKPKPPEITSVPDALAVCLDQRGRLDLDHVAALSGVSRDEAIASLGSLIYDEPGSGHLMADEYLSGDVVKKLEEAAVAAEHDPKYKRNVEALQAAQPVPLTPDKISVNIGAPWVPLDYYTEFAKEVLGLTSMEVHHDPRDNRWSVAQETEESSSHYYRRRRSRSFKPQSLRSDLNEWGTADRGPNEILDAQLNGMPIKITRTVREGSSTKTYTDEPATAQVNEVAKKMRQRFKAWVWEDAERAADLLDIYNKNYNNLVGRKFDGTHLTLPGVSLHFKLHDHQKRAIWRVLQAGNTYLAHAVGSGKTIEMIAAGMEMKRLGMISKPLYIVPNHMLQQFATEFGQLYPLANIMVADEKNFHTDNRRRFVAQAALNKPDAVIMTHSSFGKLMLKKENVKPITDQFLQDMRASLEEMAGEGLAKGRLKQMESRIEKAEQRFDSLIAPEGKDTAVTFEEMGVDFLFVDEAHQFRKLDFTSNRQVKGITPEGSKRAMDLYLKILWLNGKNTGRSFVFASGTPITNTMGELFTLMRFFDMPQMEADGTNHFDAWANMFGSVSPEAEMNAAGRYELVERFARFENVPELMGRVRTFMDVLTSSQLGAFVTRPDIKGGSPEVVITPPSEELRAYQKNVLEPRIESSKKWKPTPGEKGNPDPIINIITDGRLASIDLRFVMSGMQNDPDSKLNKYIDGIIASWEETRDNTYVDPVTGKEEPIKGGAIICFYNHGFGAGVARRGFDAKAWVAQRFKDAGIPSKEIAWIDDLKNSTEKQNAYSAMREGKVRILLGSAKKMGTGLNVQRRLAALHYLDPPWYPSDVEQPDGRILRQGNLNKVVTIRRYATKGSYDATMWQMVARKQRMIDQAFSGDASVRSIEDLSETSQYQMAAALASGDERIVKMVNLNARMESLSRLQEAHHSDQVHLVKERAHAKESIGRLGAVVKEYKAASRLVGGYVREIVGRIGNASFDNRHDFGAALIDAANKANADRKKGDKYQALGTLNGFEIGTAFDGPDFLIRITVTEKVSRGLGPYKKQVGEDVSREGLVTSMVNFMNGLDSQIAKFEESVREHETTIKRADKKIDAPFAHAQELAEVTAEIHQIEAELLAEGQTQDEIAAAQTVEEMPTSLEGDASASAQEQEPGAEFGSLHRSAPQKVTPAKMFPAKTEPWMTEDGYLVGHDHAWMVKKDFVPGPYMNRAENNGIINKTVTASGVLSRVEGVEPNEVTYKFSVDPAEGEDSKAGPLAILEDSEGNWTIVKDQYVAFILESIPGATFRAYGEENPVVVYSGDAVAGIFMPYANAGVVLASRGESGKKGRLRAVGRQKTIPMVSREQIIAALALILKRWKNHPDITVVDSISELPAGLRRQAIAAGAITGAFYNDTVYLVADGIGSIDEAYKTILHETVGHWGLRKTLGPGFDSFLSRLYADIDKARLQPIAEQYGLDLSRRSDQLVCMEEYLALLAEKGEKPSVWKRFIAWVRAWLIDKGFKLKVTQNDVDVLIASAIGKARRYVQDGKGYYLEGFESGKPLLRFKDSGISDPVTSKKGGSAFIREIGIPASIGEIITSHYNNIQVKKHPDYAAAKKGDNEAAVRLVRDMVKPDTAQAVKDRVGGGAIFVYPHAIEEGGVNAIPAMLAGYYAEQAGGTLDDSIVQNVRAFHTGAKAMERLIARATFTGDVVEGGRYVLVDDVTTMGGTLAELANHIQDNGGVVVGVATLTNASRSRNMTPSKQVLSEIERGYGSEIREQFNIEPSALTAAEAGYLLGFRDADSLRNRATAARQERAERLRAKGVRPEEVTRFRVAPSPTETPLDTKSLFPEVQERVEKSRGLGKQGSIKERALLKLEETWHAWRRHFPQLDPAKHGKFINILRLFEAVPNYSKTKARDVIKDILGKMNEQEFSVFSFNVILEDMMKDVESGLLDVDNLPAGETLPFGYTSRAQVEQDLEHFKAQAAKSSAISEALDRRDEYVQRMREDLVHHGLLDKSKLNDPAYFHHQVLEMWAIRKWTGSGVGTMDVRTHKKGWQIARKGSLKDYNTDYIESEFEVLAQGIAQIETKKTLDRIDREANIVKSLRGRARAWNESRALEIFEEKGLVEIVESQETGEIKRVTPFTPLEKQIAVGFSRLHEMASEGILEGNDEFSDVIDSLAEEGENSRVFGYLAWLLKNDAPGAMEAARIFKGIKGKEALIKSTLGDQLKTFRDLIPEGYAEWKPEPGSAWYLTNSITDKVLDQIRSGERSFDDQETRKILARGVDAVWVVPEELAVTLNDFRSYKDEGPLGKASQFLVNSWKQWVLINPYRVLKYNLNNMSGDFDICWAYDPKIIKNYMWKAGKDLLKYVRNQDLSPELKEELDTAFRKDVLGSGMTVHDITDITEHMALDGYLDVMAGRKVNAISRFWNTSKKYTTYRENILRLASYRYFKDRIAKGDKVYGASNRDVVDSIRNRDDRAALLARELVGDYGNLTVSGQWLRTKMIPFYSWCVPDYTEILTREGWKTYDQLRVGEEALTYNLQKRTTEWQRIQDKAAYPFDGDLVTLQNAYGFKYQFTEDHRVVVIEKYKDQRKVVLAKDLKTHQHIPLVSPHEFTGESVLSETDAALLGWLVTDGYFRVRAKSPNSFEAMLYQKKPSCVDLIRSTFAEYISSESVHPDTGVICFRLKASKLDKIRKVFKSKDDLPGIATQLGERECQAMYDAMLAAEGTSANGFVAFPQNNGPVLDAFQILCYMLGKAGHIRPKTCKGKEQHSLYVKKGDKIQLSKWKNTREHYKGMVWCPKTENGTWIMRQNGKVMITGNCEINAPRYVRMFYNLPIEGEGRGNMAEALTMKMARKTVGLTAKAFTLYGMVVLWNMTVAPLLCGGDDPEEELSDFERRQLHLILGRREDGSILTVRFQGALSDALAWFGLEGFPRDIKDLSSGKKTGVEQAKEMFAATPNRIVNASHPFIKMAAEELTGYSTFPDIFHPRPIRDKVEHLARMFSLDSPYRHFMGKPTRGDWTAGQFWDDVINLVGHSSDTGEAAYFDTRAAARRFMERKGVNPGYFHADSNSKSAALYNYKRALQYGDLDVAKKFLDKYMDLGGSRKGLKISVRLASPEAWVPKKYRAEFRNSLMKSDLEKYNRAMKWYREVYGGQ